MKRVLLAVTTLLIFQMALMARCNQCPDYLKTPGKLADGRVFLGLALRGFGGDAGFSRPLEEATRLTLGISEDASALNEGFLESVFIDADWESTYQNGEIHLARNGVLATSVASVGNGAAWNDVTESLRRRQYTMYSDFKLFWVTSKARSQRPWAFALGAEIGILYEETFLLYKHGDERDRLSLERGIRPLVTPTLTFYRGQRFSASIGLRELKEPVVSVTVGRLVQGKFTLRALSDSGPGLPKATIDGGLVIPISNWSRNW